MRRSWSHLLPLVLWVAVCPAFATASAGSGLHVVYGSNGIQQLTYGGIVLEDVGLFPSDTFHIWHMKASNLQGQVLQGAQYGWGEANNGRSWNAATNTWNYAFIWGSISVEFAQSGDTLNMNVTTVNNANSGIVFDGATIYPLALHFPTLPAGFTDPAYEHLAFNTTGPSATLADFGQGEVVAAVTDASKPLYSGFLPAGSGTNYFPVISSTAIDNMATFFPKNDRPVSPGQTDRYTVSLRFAPSSTALASLVGDVYKAWALTWPPQLRWNDRRIIGTLYLASSPQGNVTQPGGFPNNPRRYFSDSSPQDFDVTTPGGLIQFQAKILQQAQNDVQNLQQLNAQGAITWDIEGEQYPQNTSYVCAPDTVAQVAPEMESIIANSGSPYKGMKLDDAYFKTIRDAGFRVGVCVRPQHFTLYGDGTAAQITLPSTQVQAELSRKIQYAHDRWGATLFYVDSDVDANGGNLDPGVFQQLNAAFPDSLIIPEESTPKYYGYTAPFKTFIFHGDLGTDPEVYNYYPAAFSANLINDVDPGLLAQHRPQLTTSVKNGDILMVHADYWQSNNSTVVQIYKDAGVWSPPVTQPIPVPPPPATPASTVSITSPTAGQTISQAIRVFALMNATLDSAGSYLMVDGVEVGTHRTVGAPFAYPFDPSGLPDGQHSLQIWAHTTGNQTILSAPVSIVTAASSRGRTPLPPPSPSPPPVAPQPAYPISLTFPASGQAVSGVITVSAVIAQPLSSGGSYLTVDGKDVSPYRETSGPYNYQLDTSALSAGQHTLQVWALDISNETLASNPVVVTTGAQ